MADKLDAAVAAAMAPKAEERALVNVTIGSTGRVIAIEFPVDLTDGETTLLNSVRNQRAKTAGGRIVLPGH